jgi:hypothetical protein
LLASSRYGRFKKINGGNNMEMRQTLEGLVSDSNHFFKVNSFFKIWCAIGFDENSYYENLFEVELVTSLILIGDQKLNQILKLIKILKGMGFKLGYNSRILVTWYTTSIYQHLAFLSYSNQSIHTELSGIKILLNVNDQPEENINDSFQSIIESAKKCEFSSDALQIRIENLKRKERCYLGVGIVNHSSEILKNFLTIDKEIGWPCYDQFQE